MSKNSSDGQPEKAKKAAPQTRSRAHAPTEVQKKWLSRGLNQAGGKLPLFDDQGRGISPKTIQACIAAGWAEPWFSNPIKPDWLVCKLTDKGIAALGATGKSGKS